MLLPKLVVVDSNDRRLAQDIQGSRLVLLTFYDIHCPHSMRLFKVIREAASRFSGEVKLVRCKLGDCFRSAAYNKVLSTPTILLIKNGNVTGRSEGELNSAELLLLVNSTLR